MVVSPTPLSSPGAALANVRKRTYLSGEGLRPALGHRPHICGALGLRAQADDSSDCRPFPRRSPNHGVAALAALGEIHPGPLPEGQNPSAENVPAPTRG